MDQISSPKSLEICLNFKPYLKALAFINPRILEPEIGLVERMQIEGYSEKMLSLSYGGYSLKALNYDNLLIITFIAGTALGSAAFAKYNDRTISFLKNFAVEQLPFYGCMYTAAFVVKGLFFLGAHKFSSKEKAEPRSTVNYTKARERIAATMTTIALSTFVVPRLYEKLKGQTYHTIPSRSAIKYFTIQCTFRLAIGETFGHVAKQMRKKIKERPNDWLDVFIKNNGSFGHLNYGLEEAFCKSLHAENINQNDSWKIFYYGYHQTLNNKNKPAHDRCVRLFGKVPRFFVRVPRFYCLVESRVISFGKDDTTA